MLAEQKKTVYWLWNNSEGDVGHDGELFSSFSFKGVYQQRCFSHSTKWLQGDKENTLTHMHFIYCTVNINIASLPFFSFCEAQERLLIKLLISSFILILINLPFVSLHLFIESFCICFIIWSFCKTLDEEMLRIRLMFTQWGLVRNERVQSSGFNTAVMSFREEEVSSINVKTVTIGQWSTATR